MIRKTGKVYRRLSDEQVREIRTRYSEGGVSFRKLADEYGVSWSTIRDIVKGRIHKNEDTEY